MKEAKKGIWNRIETKMFIQYKKIFTLKNCKQMQAIKCDL